MWIEEVEHLYSLSSKWDEKLASLIILLPLLLPFWEFYDFGRKSKNLMAK